MRVDGATDTDADDSLQRKAACGLVPGATHAHTVVTDCLGEFGRYPATGLGIDFMSEEQHAVGGATGATSDASATLSAHDPPPVSHCKLF